MRKDGLPGVALYLTGKSDGPAIVGCPRPYVWPTREPPAKHGARFSLRKSYSPAEVDVAVG